MPFPHHILACLTVDRLGEDSWCVVSFELLLVCCPVGETQGNCAAGETGDLGVVECALSRGENGWDGDFEAVELGLPCCFSGKGVFLGGVARTEPGLIWLEHEVALEEAVAREVFVGSFACMLQDYLAGCRDIGTETYR